MKGCALAVALLCGLPAPGWAAEAEWSPGMGPLVGWIGGAHGADFGYGAIAHATYQPRAWLGIDMAVSWMRYADIFAPFAASRFGSGHGCSLTHVDMLPMLRFYPPPLHFWPQVFGEKLVPSLGLGLGGGVHLRGDRYLAVDGALTERLAHHWQLVPLAAVALNIEYRPFEAASLGLRVRQLWAFSAHLHVQSSSEAGLYGAFAFYP